MIRYPWTEAEIEQVVDATIPSWRSRAQDRTIFILNRGKYEEPTGTNGKPQKSIWPEVKEFYINKQCNKCIYCERVIRKGKESSVEWALEHFRPKGKVKAWIPKPEDITSGFDYADINLGDELAEGYYPLAYHLWNYAASCHTCNSSFKKDYFPIAGARITGKNHPSEYRLENAYLIYPFDSTDADPKDLITFNLYEAAPHPQWVIGSPEYIRACVIIDFLGLNSDGLLLERAKHLYYPVLLSLEKNDSNRLRSLSSAKEAFTNCTQCFIQDYQNFPEKHADMEKDLREFLAEKGVL
jgi:hypothetical protein